MVHAAGGRGRTADLAAQEAARKAAQEAARKAAEEAARKAAEEAARKAAEEAARKAAEKAAQEAARKAAAEKKATPHADKRKENYQAAKTRPLSEETARLNGITAKYGAGEAKPAAASKTPSLDAAKAQAAENTKGMQDRISEAKEKFPKASADTKGKVDTLEKKAHEESGRVIGAGSKHADELVAHAEKEGGGKSPADQKTIMAQADKHATAIFKVAAGAAGMILGKAGELGAQGLKDSHEYENKNLLEKAVAKAGDFLGGLRDGAVKLFENTVDSVAEVTKSAVEHKGEFSKWVGEQAFKAADSALDGSPLGEDTAYTQEKTGALGDAVTNRLEVGESAFIKLDADANINGVALGAGAELEVKRVAATDAEGKPRLEPTDEHGQPPTELEVTLMVDARAGAGLSASFGVGGSAKHGPESVAGNDITMGAQAGASASVEAGVQGQAEFTFTFDPNSQKDMDDLSGVLSTTAKSAIPVVGALNAPNAAQAAQNFGSHLTAVRGEVGVYASAQASVDASLGNISEDAHGKGGEVAIDGGKQLAASGNKVKPDKAEGADETQPDEAEKKDFGLKGTAAGMALDKANLNLGELTAGLSGEVNVGAEHNFRSGETTVYLNVKGDAHASASTVGDLSKAASAEGNRTIALTLDKNGELKGVDVTEEMSSSKFKGIGDQDVRGRLDSAFLAQVEESDSVKVTRSYTPAALAEFKQQAGEKPTAALGNLTQSLLQPDPNAKLTVTDIKATKTDAMNYGFNVAGTGIQIGMGRRIETDVDTFKEPTKQNSVVRGQLAAR